MTLHHSPLRHRLHRMPRGRTTAALILAFAFVLAFAVVTCSHPPGGGIEKNGPVIVETRPVPLDFSTPERDTVGRLRYRGGLALRSTDERLGGLSGLLIHPGGGAFTAISDNGYWIGANLIHDEDGNLAGIADMTIMPMLAPDGRPLRSASERDAEALARAPEGGIFVGFERDHRLWRYEKPGALPAPTEGPAELEEQPSSQGLEGLTLLADNRLFAISEGLETEGGVVGWVRDAGGRWSRFTWRTGGGFQPTGAAILPDGDVLVLERRFPPVGARVRRIAPAAIAPGATLEGEELALLEGTLSVDNMEAIDAIRSPDGKTLIYVASDDNYSPLQTTLLMMFELLD
jgi:hypothetical protein